MTAQEREAVEYLRQFSNALGRRDYEPGVKLLIAAIRTVCNLAERATEGDTE